MTIRHICGGLHIGDVDSLQYQEQRKIFGISAVVNCACELTGPRFNCSELGDDYLFLDLVDGDEIPEEKINNAISFISDRLDHGKKVLVACALGASRSASIIIAWLMTEGWTGSDALLILQRLRPVVNPATITLQSVYDWWNEMWDKKI